MAEYQIILHDAFGNQLAYLDNFYRLEYARKVNDIGALSINLPDDWDINLFKVDGRIAVMRSVGGPLYLEGETLWLIRKIERILSDTGEIFKRISCVDTVDLLRRRIVAYHAGSAQAEKNVATAVDDMMKDIVDENMGATATDTARDWSSLVSIQPDLSQCIVVTKAFAYRNVLTVLQELAKLSFEADGTYLAFDIVATGMDTLQFRTYTEQRGIDHRVAVGQPSITFGPEWGNATTAERTFDHSEEWTYVLAAGQGEEAARDWSEGIDATRTGISPFGRIEYFRDARHVPLGSAALLADEQEAALYEGRPRRSFTASVLDTASCTYGLHYRFGDRVTVQFGKESFDARIEGIHVTLEGGAETFDPTFRVDDD